MKLLENVYYHKEKKEIYLFLKAEGGMYLGFPLMPQLDKSVTYYRYIPDYVRPLELNEQVDYLYNLALNGSAFEFRTLFDWIDDESINNTDTGYLYHYFKEGLSNPDKFYSDKLKQIIRNKLILNGLKLTNRKQP